MQFKQVLSVLCLCVTVVMSGCVMPAKTKVTKDGFTARQKTVEAHRAIVEDYDVYRTDCRYDQLALESENAPSRRNAWCRCIDHARLADAGRLPCVASLSRRTNFDV